MHGQSRPRFLLVPLLAAAVLVAGCPLALASEDLTPRPQRVFTEKPRIEDYTDYNAFLVDIMEFRRQKAERAAASAAAKASTTGPVDDQALAGVNGANGVTDPELYRIRGPESLEDALARARKLPHPVYEEQERYGRTTSQSFPIAELEGDDMSANEVAGELHDLQAVQPDPYLDPSAEEHAVKVVADNPDNTDETQAKQAFEGTDDAYEVAIDTETRFIRDSDGRTIWAPIFVKDEVSYTVINRLSIEVTTFRN